MRIVDSARRHGVADDDIEHAFRNQVRTFDGIDDTSVIIGVDRAGRFLELGVFDDGDETVVMHAMSARPKYLR